MKIRDGAENNLSDYAGETKKKYKGLRKTYHLQTEQEENK